jgi:hypothetical protein
MFITILGWIASIVCILFGALWLNLNIARRQTIENELRLMKQPGHLWGKGNPTPRAVGRVLISEGDLRASKRHRLYAISILALGIIGALVLLFRH